MNEFDIPIFKKAYELYKIFFGYRKTVSKQDRFTIWQRSENSILDVVEGILHASQLSRAEKLPVLEKTSLRLNVLRVFFRMMMDVRTIDGRKYLILEQMVDEIGRMLGGWIKSVKERET